MHHQRAKARAMATKHGMDGGAPPMPQMPDMGSMNAQPPMPQGMSDPSAVQSSPMPAGAPGGGFKRGGMVGGRK